MGKSEGAESGSDFHPDGGYGVESWKFLNFYKSHDEKNEVGSMLGRRGGG